MKKIFFLLVLVVISSNVNSQTVYLADTAFITDRGYGGAEASCVFKPGGFYLGWEMGRAQDAWIADVFTIPKGETWVFDTAIIYGYQRGSGLTSTFLNCNLQIFKGTPGLGGTVVWGDTSTNVLSNSGFTGIYRVDTTAASGGLLNNTRPIMYLKLFLSPAPSLGEGTYWLAWSTSGSLPIIPNCAEKVLPGRINPSGQSARQLVKGSWNYMEDSGNTLGMNMIIKASKGLAVNEVSNKKSQLLNQNFPNPFNNSTTISFSLSVDDNVKLCVYNSIGKLIKVLTNQFFYSGYHEITFNSNNLPEGIYFYQINTSMGSEQRLMEITR